MKKTEFGLEYLIQNQYTLNETQNKQHWRTLSTKDLYVHVPDGYAAFGDSRVELDKSAFVFTVAEQPRGFVLPAGISGSLDSVQFTTPIKVVAGEPIVYRQVLDVAAQPRGIVFEELNVVASEPIIYAKPAPEVAYGGSGIVWVGALSVTTKNVIAYGYSNRSTVSHGGAGSILIPTSINIKNNTV